MKSLSWIIFLIAIMASGIQTAGYARPGTSISPLADELETAPLSPSDSSLQADSAKTDNNKYFNGKNQAADFRAVRKVIEDKKTPKIRKVWPTGALLRSALLPGWGQVYNRNYIKAGIYGGLEIFLLYKARQNWRQMDAYQTNFMNTDDPAYKAEQFNLYIKRRDDRNIYLWFAGLTIFISMFDAYVDAHLANFNQTDKAFEVFVEPDDGRVKIGLACKF